MLPMPPTCQILPTTDANLTRCADLLRGGAVIGVPTETVYGLAGDACSTTAVRKIFEVKGRPLIDPLIIHCRSLQDATRHARFSPEAEALARRFWPGALTLVLPKRPHIPDLVTAGLSSVAVRVPAHPALQALLQRLEVPLAAPSANPFGYVSPTLAQHVVDHLGDRIAAVLDGGPCGLGVESTIVDLRDPARPKLLRPGPINAATLGLPLRHGQESAPPDGDGPQAAPGLLTQHYSPNAAITLFAAGDTAPKPSADSATLFARKPPSGARDAHCYWLSEDGELGEIARNLFRTLRKLDQAGYHRLYVEKVPDEGIGVAINDRLQRAAAKGDVGRDRQSP